MEILLIEDGEGDDFKFQNFIKIAVLNQPTEKEAIEERLKNPLTLRFWKTSCREI